MYKKYKDQEKRRLYLRNYRIKNRKKQYEYFKKFYQLHKNEWYKYSQKYTYKRKNGELLGTSGLGRKYEKIALNLLDGSIDRNIDCFTGKWDIEWNGYKIDVKMRNKNKKGNWHFTTKPNPIADYYLCFCVENEFIKKVYFIPKKIFKVCIEIRENNKLDKFLLTFSKLHI